MSIIDRSHYLFISDITCESNLGNEYDKKYSHYNKISTDKFKKLVMFICKILNELKDVLLEEFTSKADKIKDRDERDSVYGN